MPEPTLRRATFEDAAILSTLSARTFTETFGHLYDSDDLQAFLADSYGGARTEADLADPRKAAWLVEVDGDAVGYALAGPCDLPHADVTPDCGELKRLYFLQGHQGGGLGARLFGEVIDWLQRDGPRAVWIGVWSENHGAQRFYERHGFEPAGEYGFRVGRTLDREFILRRGAESFSRQASQLAQSGHKIA